MPQVAPYSGAMLAMVARSASGNDASPGPKNSTNLPTTPVLRSISVTVSTRPVAVDHRGVRVGSHQRVRISHSRAIALFGKDHARQILQVHLMDDSHVRRHDLEIPEGRLPPAQEGIAFFVALKFQLRVHRERPDG